jgi:hypothetical protein
MRFLARRDYQTFMDINKELINTVIDTIVGIHKINVVKTPANIYGESTRKTYFTAVKVPCLIQRDQTTATLDGNIISSTQNVEFRFLHKELEERNIYPEAGDVIEYDASYYEIVNTSETQLIVGQTDYNHSIICQAVLTRSPAVQLDRPTI